MKNGKRIESITIKRMLDEYPDLSYLGEYKRQRRLKRMLGAGMLFAGMTAGITWQSRAQGLPEAPVMQPSIATMMNTVKVGETARHSRPWLTRTEAVDAGMMLAANLGDWRTTEEFLRVGGKEDQLPAGLVGNSAGFLAFKLAETAGDVEVERLVDRSQRWQRFEHGHRIVAGAAMQLGVLAVAGMTARVDNDNRELARNLARKSAPTTSTQH